MDLKNHLITEEMKKDLNIYKNDMNALMIASYYNYPDIIDLSLDKSIIDKSIIVNKVNKKGMTALMYASENGHSEIISKLLDLGANEGINLKDNFLEETALIKASFPRTYDFDERHEKSVKLLLEAGADINIKDKEKKTALEHVKDNIFTNIDVSEEEDDDRIVTVLKTIENVKQILKNQENRENREKQEKNLIILNSIKKQQENGGSEAKIGNLLDNLDTPYYMIEKILGMINDGKRKSVKRKPVKRKSTKRKSTKRKSVKRKSVKRK